MRKQFVWLHRWLGLGAGLVVFLVCFSGAILTFEEPVEDFLNRQYLRPTDVRITWQTLYQAAQAQLEAKEAVRRLYLTTGKVQVRGPKGNRDLFFSTDSGSFEGAGTGFVELVLGLHRRLLLDDFGRWLTLGSCLFCIGLTVTGIRLWLPAKWSKWKSGFEIRARASRRRFLFDLHRVVGICFALPFLLVAMTGLNYSKISKPFRATLLTLTGARPVELPVNPSPRSALSQPLTLDQAVETAVGVFPDAGLSCLEMVEKPSGCLKVRFRHEGQLGQFGQSFVLISLATGEVLQVYNAVEQALGQRLVTEWALPLHRGEAFGFLHRLLWCGLALSGMMLPLTGYWLWWNKKKPASTSDTAAHR